MATTSITFHEATTMAHVFHREPAFLRRKQVERRTGLSRSTLYQYMKDGRFPKPVKLGPRAVGWLEADVNDWIEARLQGAQVHGARET